MNERAHGRHHEAECAADETALRAATARDQARLAEFVVRADEACRGLRAVQKALDELVYEQDRALAKQKQHVANRAVRKVHGVLVRSSKLSLCCETC